MSGVSTTRLLASSYTPKVFYSPTPLPDNSLTFVPGILI